MSNITKATKTQNLEGFFNIHTGAAWTVNAPGIVCEELYAWARDLFVDAIKYGHDTDWVQTRVYETVGGHYIWNSENHDIWKAYNDGNYFSTADYEISHKDYDDLNEFFAVYVQIATGETMYALVLSAYEAYEQQNGE